MIFDLRIRQAVICPKEIAWFGGVRICGWPMERGTTSSGGVFWTCDRHQHVISDQRAHGHVRAITTLHWVIPRVDVGGEYETSADAVISSVPC